MFGKNKAFKLKEYNHQELGISLQIPDSKDWYIDSTDQVPLTIVANANALFKANLIFTTANLRYPTIQWLEQAASENQKLSAQQREDYTALSLVKTEIDGCQAYLALAEQALSGNIIDFFKLTILTKYDQYLAVTGGYLKADTAMYKPLFDQIINSIHFIAPAQTNQILPRQDSTEENTLSIKAHKHLVPAFGLTIAVIHDQGWESKADSTTQSVTFYAPRESGYRARLTFQYAPLKQTSFEKMEQTARQARIQFLKERPQAKVSPITETSIDGCPALKWSAQTRRYNEKLKADLELSQSFIYVLTEQHPILQINIKSLTALTDKYIPIFEAMIDSIEFNQL
jgi:hypothetical protein